MAQITPTTVTIANGDPIEAEPLQLVIDKLNEAITLLNSHDTDILGKASTAALTTLSNSVTTLANSLTAEAATRQNADTDLANGSVASVEDDINLTEDGRLTYGLIARNDSGTKLSDVQFGCVAKILPFGGLLPSFATVQQVSTQGVDYVVWDKDNLCFVGVTDQAPNPVAYYNNWGGEGAAPAAEEYARTPTNGGWMEPFRNIIYLSNDKLLISLNGVTLEEIYTNTL